MLPGPTGPAIPTGSSDSSVSGAPSAGSISPAPSAAASSPSHGAAVIVDSTLLDVLPSDVGGVERRGDEATAAEIAAGTDVATAAEAIAVALYIGGPAADGSAEVSDYAVVTVTRLRPGLLDEAFHRDWRDSFDAGVCEAAGGVDGHAEAEIGGHRTFIGTCTGGVRTYHVALADERILVSMQALGAARLGERIVEGLAR
jgi:hypothetical protein